jgi:ATP-binding cassette subfamily B protein
MKMRRIPVVLQMNSVECGAACLAMILRYFGRSVRLEECREKCDPGRDGVTARTIVTAAREFGLRTRAFSVDGKSMDVAQLPCIIHWNNNHFVVLEKRSGQRVVIVDPACGRRQVTAFEFEAGFSGVVLLLEPGPGFAVGRASRPSLSLGYVKNILRTPGTPAILAQILAASVLLQTFGLALPFFTKLVVDRMLPGKAVSQLDMFCIGGLIVACMTASAGYVRALLLVRLEAQLDSHLMLKFFHHLLSLPFRFFQQRSSGDLLMRLGSNATIRQALASSTTSAILDGTLIFVFAAALLRVSPPFGVAALFIGLIEVTVLFSTARPLQRLMENDLASQSASQSCLVESLMGIGTLKASGVEQSTYARWSDLLAKQLDHSAQRGRFSAKVDAITAVVRTFSPLFLLWLGAKLVLSGSLSLGTMLGINALAAAFLQPIGSLVLSGQRLQLAAGHVERIADVMHAKPEQELDVVQPAPRLSGKVELRNVSFRYNAHSPKVLDDISLVIEPGQKVALVGRTGSGKSTLAKLLLGLYLPTEGEILYDGVPLCAMDLRTLRRQWGTALQDSFIFSSSLRENISFHDPSISTTDLVRAAKIAAIHSDIMEMPMGYETRVEEGGSTLSGGQRQRLAIARAVANRPPFLLLDETTSHLDVTTESLVDRNLDRLSCTRVVVAHRLSTIRNSDLIVVLHDGAVVEQGSHQELLDGNGHYAALVLNQPERTHDESLVSRTRQNDRSPSILESVTGVSAQPADSMRDAPNKERGSMISVESRSEREDLGGSDSSPI